MYKCWKQKIKVTPLAWIYVSTSVLVLCAWIISNRLFTFHRILHPQAKAEWLAAGRRGHPKSQQSTQTHFNGSLKWTILHGRNTGNTYNFEGKLLRVTWHNKTLIHQLMWSEDTERGILALILYIETLLRSRRLERLVPLVPLRAKVQM